MGFSSMNAVNSVKGLQGTSRQSSTFTGLGGAPQAPGMQAPLQTAQAVPQGSSYSTSGGMQNTARTNDVNLTNYASMPDANGVIAGQQGKMADVGQVGPRLTNAEMQDPANAALAGFQFAQGPPAQAPAPVNAGQPQAAAAPAAPNRVPATSANQALQYGRLM